jgi:hypothetical protein
VDGGRTGIREEIRVNERREWDRDVLASLRCAEVEGREVVVVLFEEGRLMMVGSSSVEAGWRKLVPHF